MVIQNGDMQGRVGLFPHCCDMLLGPFARTSGTVKKVPSVLKNLLPHLTAKINYSLN